VAEKLLITFLEALKVFEPALTKPGFANMIVVLTGWVLDPGAVTQTLVATSMAGESHHEKYHRFFSRGSWNPDELGKRLFHWIVRRIPATDPIRIAVDDTVAPKKGEKVFGVDAHLDAVRSTKKYKVFCIGHCWVVVACLVKFPFSKQPWALPVLFRLYQNKKTCAKKKIPYRKKTELARDMIDTVVEWVNGRTMELTGDSAYCNSTITKDLPKNVDLIGDMRPDAVLTALPPKRIKNPGRPKLRGRTLAKPKVLAHDTRRPWKSCQVNLYGKIRTVRYKECFAQWYRACGTGLLHVVVVHVEHGTIGIRVFFSTNINMTVKDILEGYAGRWSIEVCFKNMKQLLGFADSSARKPAAVKRVAPFVGFIYTLLILWFSDHAYRTSIAKPPVRPWYPHKQGVSFADILRAGRRTLAPNRFLDLAPHNDNLHKYLLLNETTTTTRKRAA